MSNLSAFDNYLQKMFLFYFYNTYAKNYENFFPTCHHNVTEEHKKDEIGCEVQDEFNHGSRVKQFESVSQ